MGSERRSAARRVLLILAVVVGVLAMHSLAGCVTTSAMGSDITMAADHQMPDGNHAAPCVDHCSGVIAAPSHAAIDLSILLLAVMSVASSYIAGRKSAVRQRSSGLPPPSLAQLCVLRV